MIYRKTNSDCLTCGSQKPARVTLEQSGDYYEYKCPKCGITVVQRVVATNGAVSDSPAITPPEVRRIVLPEQVEWDTWEAWWTRYQALVRIHGRNVYGDSEFAEFVDYIQEQANG